MRGVIFFISTQSRYKSQYTCINYIIYSSGCSGHYSIAAGPFSRVMEISARTLGKPYSGVFPRRSAAAVRYRYLFGDRNSSLRFLHQLTPPPTTTYTYIYMYICIVVINMINQKTAGREENAKVMAKHFGSSCRYTERRRATSARWRQGRARRHFCN